MTSRPKTLQDLPIELQDAIFDNLESPQDLHALGSTSRWFHSHAIIERLQFHTIQCDLRRCELWHWLYANQLFASRIHVLHIFDEELATYTSPILPHTTPLHARVTSPDTKPMVYRSSSVSKTESLSLSPETALTLTIPKLDDIVSVDNREVSVSDDQNFSSKASNLEEQPRKELPPCCDHQPLSLSDDKSTSPSPDLDKLDNNEFTSQNAPDAGCKPDELTIRSLVPLEKLCVLPLEDVNISIKALELILPLMRRVHKIKWVQLSESLSGLLPRLLEQASLSFFEARNEFVSSFKTMLAFTQNALTSLAITLPSVSHQSTTASVDYIISFAARCTTLEKLEIHLHPDRRADLIRLLKLRWDNLSHFTLSQVLFFSETESHAVRPALYRFLQAHRKISCLYLDISKLAGRAALPFWLFLTPNSLALSGGFLPQDVKTWIPATADLSHIQNLMMSFDESLKAIIPRFSSLRTFACRCPSNKSLPALLQALPSSLESLSIMQHDPFNFAKFKAPGSDSETKLEYDGYLESLSKLVKLQDLAGLLITTDVTSVYGISLLKEISQAIPTLMKVSVKIGKSGPYWVLVNRTADGSFQDYSVMDGHLKASELYGLEWGQFYTPLSSERNTLIRFHHSTLQR
ncbi:hypothetical protein M422DRAFT_64949 [Sphaerobolus stellatus SS14]|nr:hypothetical protein M422DRAFT_64949 [Sphaerobolus stellatus SS14]